MRREDAIRTGSGSFTVRASRLLLDNGGGSCRPGEPPALSTLCSELSPAQRPVLPRARSGAQAAAEGRCFSALPEGGAGSWTLPFPFLFFLGLNRDSKQMSLIQSQTHRQFPPAPRPVCSGPSFLTQGSTNMCFGFSLSNNIHTIISEPLIIDAAAAPAC